MPQPPEQELLYLHLPAVYPAELPVKQTDTVRCPAVYPVKQADTVRYPAVLPVKQADTVCCPAVYPADEYPAEHTPQWFVHGGDQFGNDRSDETAGRNPQ